MLRDVNMSKTKVRNVIARKLGSLFVAEVSLEVEPSVTILELHKIRKRVTGLVRRVSSVIYHVDVTFYPSYTRRTISRFIRWRKD